VVSLGIFFPPVVPPTEPCALRSTQPLKVSTRDFSRSKGGRCFWLTTYHPCSAETSRKSRALTYPGPLRPPRPVAGDLYFTFINYQLDAQIFFICVISRYVFRAIMLIIRRSHYCTHAALFRNGRGGHTVRPPRPLLNTDDIICCVYTTMWHPDDKHCCSKHVAGYYINKEHLCIKLVINT